MTIEHFRNGFVVFHPPKTAKIAGSPRGRIRGQMRGWPSPEGHPAAQVDGIGHEGVQCMRASIVTASGAHQTTLRAHFSKKKKKMPQSARGGPEHHGNAFSDVVSGPKCPNFAVSA